jgi:hypothetical protein
VTADPSVDHRRANDDSRARLRQLVARADRGQLATTVMEGWSAGALLAHLAFWDRFTLLRWRSRLAGNTVADVGPLADLLKDAALPTWNDMAPEVAAREAIAAADEVDTFVAGLPPDVVAQVVAEGKPRWVLRSGHRREHLEQIERGIAR